MLIVMKKPEPRPPPPKKKKTPLSSEMINTLYTSQTYLDVIINWSGEEKKHFRKESARKNEMRNTLYSPQNKDNDEAKIPE